MSVRQGGNTIAGTGYTKSEIDTIANGKANVALDNITSAGKTVCANMAMPSGTYTNLTIGTHGTSYSAPADGYFIVKGYNSSATLSNLLGCLNTSTGLGYSITPSNYSGSESTVTVPAKKGEQVVIYNYGGTFTMVRFVYANGAA